MILAMAWISRWSDRALLRRPRFSCDCGCGVEGLARARCPECGAGIDGRGLLRERVGRFRRTAVLVAVFEVAAFSFLCRGLFVDVLGAYRALKIDTYTFVPGYKHLTHLDGTDLLLGSLVIALWATVVVERTRATRWTIAAYQARVRPAAEAFDERIKLAAAGVL
jgi:hypothetical protein